MLQTRENHTNRSLRVSIPIFYDIGWSFLQSRGCLENTEIPGIVVLSDRNLTKGQRSFIENAVAKSLGHSSARNVAYGTVGVKVAYTV
jgi:hypothetical protein